MQVFIFWCSGDLWQLPPPDGGFVRDIPCEFIQASRTYFPAPTVVHGQSLLRSNALTGMTVVTELEKCERTKDVWSRSIQDEFRIGKLTKETHAFSHGEPTMQPGSILNGNVMCGHTKCTKRSSVAIGHFSFNKEFAATTRWNSYPVCKKERASRTLVASDGNDPRFQEEKFASAPGIFGNHDIKYDVNKLRAQSFAS